MNKSRDKEVKGLISAKGFTLLETIVALAIIVSAITGPLSLASRGIFSAKFSKNKLIAANLAQEGLELVRKLRDDNILAGRAWDFGMGVGFWQSDVLGTPALSPFTGVPLLRDATSGIYNYSSGNATQFVREIEIRRIDSNTIVVFSTVMWSDAGIARSVLLNVALLNWI